MKLALFSLLSVLCFKVVFSSRVITGSNRNLLTIYPSSPPPPQSTTGYASCTLSNCLSAAEYSGNSGLSDFARVEGSNPVDCASSCCDIPTCTYYVYVSGSCYLKTGTLLATATIAQSTGSDMASCVVAHSPPPSTQAEPMQAPVAAPMQAPQASPMQAPVAAPMQGPVAAPMQGPVATPMQAPVAAPMQAPVAAPMQAPQAAPSSGCKLVQTCYKGYDIDHKKMGAVIATSPKSSCDDCEKACKQHSSCGFWNYKKSGSSKPGTCTMKSGTPPAITRGSKSKTVEKACMVKRSCHEDKESKDDKEHERKSPKGEGKDEHKEYERKSPKGEGEDEDEDEHKGEGEGEDEHHDRKQSHWSSGK